MLTDTAPEAAKVQIELLRKATIAERIAKARSLTAMTIGLSRRAIQRAHADWSPEEVDVKFVELHYGKELAAGLRKYLRKHPSCRPQTP